MTYIKEDHLVFQIRSENTSLLFKVNEYGHPEHIYYGKNVDIEDADILSLKHFNGYGERIDYDEESEYCLDERLLEWSGNGRGDFRESPLELFSDHGTTTDFKYSGFEIIKGSVPAAGHLPLAYGEDETLLLHLKDERRKLSLDLIYGVSYASDVITRRTVIYSNDPETVRITGLMSFMMDLAEDDLVMMTFTGGWSNEAHLTQRTVVNGRYVNSSSTGSSSNRANPGFILRKQNTDELHGEAWGFNYVYSGNHCSSVSCDEHGIVRVMGGINPERFEWQLNNGEYFCTPQMFMTYSDRGLNTLSHHFHNFINNHIVRGVWKNKPRPVLVNDWEAFMFDFTEDSIVSLAEQGRDLGAELFVLDDGWFGERNHDRAGLGDYTPNPSKLPNGIKGLSDRIHGLGMMFGLWFEPEAVNPDSDLYRAHPDWAIHDSLYDDLYGRHEMLLDLTQSEVRDYIVENVSRTIDEGGVDYVKWDMNRHMTGTDGAFAYRYILGLYEVLERIFAARPQVLLESCSSGGNRFDAGMMCYSPQIWTSDDTDAIERLDIQKGCSYLYPQSTMGAHVSAVPNAQTMRTVPLSTRFAVSAFGVLGYELDLRRLTYAEKKEAAEEIQWYKQHRELLQFGLFCRNNQDRSHENWTIAAKDGSAAVCGIFRRLLRAEPKNEKMVVNSIREDLKYAVEGRSFLLCVPACSELAERAEKSGTLLKEEDGSCAVLMPSVRMTGTGRALKAGVQLYNVCNGTGYNCNIRMPQDFGSEIFVIEKI